LQPPAYRDAGLELARELNLGEYFLKTRKQSRLNHFSLDSEARWSGAIGMLFVLACCGGAAAQQTIWPSSTVPASLDNGARRRAELGFRSSRMSAGTITGIRFYKSLANSGTHVGRLWGPPALFSHP